MFLYLGPSIFLFDGVDRSIVVWPLSRVPVFLFSVEILCPQLGGRHRYEILVSLLVDFASAD
jgi:hypothetical protein